MHKKINVYIFGESGIYDEYSPAYVSNMELVPEVLYIIADNEPFSISKEEIIKDLKIDEQDFNNIINSLKLINAIDIIDNKYKLNFTVFLEKDMPLMDKYFLNIGKIVGDKIIEKRHLIYEKISELNKDACFSMERLLYHIICDNIFDGTAFSFFSEKNIFQSSKVQPGDRDYIMFGYEDSVKVDGHSNGILCSSNNYRSESFVFNSFGDSNGIRKDMYRFSRKVLKALENATPFISLFLSYIKLIEDKNREIAEKCGKIIWKSYKNQINILQLSENEKDLTSFLNKLGYLHINEKNGIATCSVPIFEKADTRIINEISEIILNNIYYIVKDTFEKFETDAADLTAIKHRIGIKELAIELWHQVFGFTNEYLVKTGFVESPGYKKGEGRYLRSFEINR